ncbi:hypothetical protein BGX26_007899, partial [Mortierella sp. AD094]
MVSANETYCDDSFGGDCSVDSARILKFFEDVMFVRTVKKFVSQDAGYSGQIGLAPPSTGAESSQDTEASASILSRKKPDPKDEMDPIYDPWFNKKDPTWKPLEKSTNSDRDDIGQSSTTDASNSLPNLAGNGYGDGALGDNPEDEVEDEDEHDPEDGDEDEHDPEDEDEDDPEDEDEDDPEDLPAPSLRSKQVLEEQKTKYIDSISDGSK